MATGLSKSTSRFVLVGDGERDFFPLFFPPFLEGLRLLPLLLLLLLPDFLTFPDLCPAGYKENHKHNTGFVTRE